MSTIKESATVCELNDLLFPVEVRNEDLPSNSEYSKRIVGSINGSDYLLNQCSPRYELVKNVNIFPNIETILDNAGIDYTVKYKHIDHVRFYGDYVIEDSRFTYNMNGTSDSIKPIIYVQHSYNGMTNYKIVFGYYRLVCENGLTIPIEEMKDYNLSIVGKHTEMIKKSFEKLNEMLVNFVDNKEQITRNITSKYERLGGVWVANPEDRIIEVLEASKIGNVNNKNFSTVDEILTTIRTESNLQGLGYNGKVNDWLIYNAINQYINNDSLNIKSPEKRREIDTKVLETMLS